MKTVAIIGVGLIGGSFGLALREAGFEGEILGVSSPPALETALRLGAISAAATLEQAAQSADLIYLAQPVDRILESLETLGPLAPAHCLITDAGSTKAVIVQKAAGCRRTATFLGGHPIAGKEQRGVEAADAHLLRRRLYVLTPTAPESPISRDFRVWLQRFGARILDMPANQHDATVAFTSHLPQLLSTALAATLAEQPNPQISRVFGAGLLDMTRLALSSPDLWLSIVETNKGEISKALDAIIESLADIKKRLSDENLQDFFISAASFASRIRALDSTELGL
jgi:prephenate dehydrogenase